MGAIVNFISKFANKVDPEVTWRLDSFEFSKKHHHEICVMQLVGKNVFPKMTPLEILSNPAARKGLSIDDVIIITKLNERIKTRMQKHTILEVDTNGIIVLQDARGNVRRYSEKIASSNRTLIKGMLSEDAHDLGYRVGFKDGVNIRVEKIKTRPKLGKRILTQIPKIIRFK